MKFAKELSFQNLQLLNLCLSLLSFFIFLFFFFSLLACFLLLNKHHDQNQLVKERVYSSLLTVVIHHEGKSGQELIAGTWRPELRQRPGTGAAY